jgi:uncharacterized membrane protein YgcG
MSEEDFNFTDLGFGDRFVFVSADGQPPLTASDVLNIVTANFPVVPNFIGDPFEIRHSSDIIRFNPPQIESVNNGDDIFVRFTSEDNTFAFEVFANADGSKSDITIRNLLLDPIDFAALILPVDPEDIFQGRDIDLQTMFGDFGFVMQNPFASADLTQGLDGLDFGGLTVGDVGFFGSLFGSGGFGSGFAAGGDFGGGFSFGGGFGGGGSGGGGGRISDLYSSYEGIDYINLDIWG